MTNINIFKATVESFEGYGPRSTETQKLIVDENSIFKINCVIDYENNKAIVLETGEIYDLLKRNSRGFIINNRDNEIKFNHPYVTDYSLIDLEKYSFVYALNMKALAKKTYENYTQNNLLKSEKTKVKKFGKKNG